MTGHGCLPAAGHCDRSRSHDPYRRFLTASGWRARRELREGVVTVVVSQPPVVSEMYAAVAPLFVGSAASAFPLVVRAPPGFL